MTRARSDEPTAWAMFDRAIASGSAAAERGEPLTANPWRPETLGGKAWALGWETQQLPWPLRALARLYSAWCRR